MEISKWRQKIYEMKKDALKMALTAGKAGSHLGGGFSAMEIIGTLYLEEMDLEKDRFFLGKAHAVLAYYAALKQVGYLTAEDLENFEKNTSICMGHPIREEKRGIYYSGGSLGMALSAAVGSALHFKKQKKQGKIYVLLGDGECQEGSIWEAVMTAAHFQLDNLIGIIDKNGLQYDASTKDLLGIDRFFDKFQAFQWAVVEADGHDVLSLKKAFAAGEKNKPLLIEASTRKGNGISFMQDNLEYHHKELTAEQYKIAMQELAKEYELDADNFK